MVHQYVLEVLEMNLNFNISELFLFISYFFAFLIFSMIRDIQHREVYLSVVLGDQSLTGDETVASILGNLPPQLLLDIEAEVNNFPAIISIVLF